MKFLILNADYPDFLQWLYARHHDLAARPYAEQMRLRQESLYGVADFYSSNLRAIGHEAEDVYANNEWLQKTWAAEQGIAYDLTGAMSGTAVSVLERVKKAVRKMPMRPLTSYVRSWLPVRQALPTWLYDILRSQIERYKPDILLNQAVDAIPGQFIKKVKPYVRLIVGQHAATRLSESEDYGGYDLMISSFPPTVAWCQQKGLRAYQCRLGFEPRVLSTLLSTEELFDVTFSGNLFSVHRSREVWLEGVSRLVPQLKMWGPDIQRLAPTSPLRNHYAGSAWGRDMYQVLRASKITLNHHGDVAPFANNMRLFEATGVGTCLITDWKQNLGEMFEVGKELAAYRSMEECAELVQYYLAHEEEREAIGRAGQARTLREHTYSNRMQEFIRIVEQHV